MPFEFERTSEIIQLTYQLAALIGVPAAVILFWQQQGERLRQGRERITLSHRSNYTEVNDRYLNFLELQARYPRLGTTVYERTNVRDSLSPEEVAQQRAIFEYLISICERAFIAHRETSDSVEEYVSWDHWGQWISGYFANPNFAAYWEEFCATGMCEMFTAKYVEFLRQASGAARASG